MNKLKIYLNIWEIFFGRDKWICIYFNQQMWCEKMINSKVDLHNLLIWESLNYTPPVTVAMVCCLIQQMCGEYLFVDSPGQRFELYYI